VALMPFALNEATRFISPTKTLEYMAGGKPVVSTPIQDVQRLYGSAVALAPAGDAFVQACEAVLAEGVDDRSARHAEMGRLVACSSWQATADAVHVLLKDAAAPGDAGVQPIAVGA
jgi:glycosyltransferase involved in cell wall biosynthesis